MRAVLNSQMAADPFPLHHRTEVLLAIDPDRLFAYLDDPRSVARHMEKPSLRTAGASMRIETDERQGQSIGSWIRLTGTVLGMSLSVEEVVTRRNPPHEKVWETIGEPRFLVIGAYRMGFEISRLGRARGSWSSSTTDCRAADSPDAWGECWGAPTPHGARGARPTTPKPASGHSMRTPAADERRRAHTSAILPVTGTQGLACLAICRYAAAMAS